MFFSCLTCNFKYFEKLCEDCHLLIFFSKAVTWWHKYSALNWLIWSRYLFSYCNFHRLCFLETLVSSVLLQNMSTAWIVLQHVPGNGCLMYSQKLCAQWAIQSHCRNYMLNYWPIVTFFQMVNSILEVHSVFQMEVALSKSIVCKRRITGHQMVRVVQLDLNYLLTLMLTHRTCARLTSAFILLA